MSKISTLCTFLGNANRRKGDYGKTKAALATIIKGLHSGVQDIASKLPDKRRLPACHQS